MAAPAAVGDEIAVESALQAIHGVDGLRFDGGGNGDDLDILMGEKSQEVGFDLGLELILARLAGEDDDEGEATTEAGEEVNMEEGLLGLKRKGFGHGILDLDCEIVNAAGKREGEKR